MNLATLEASWGYILHAYFSHTLNGYVRRFPIHEGISLAPVLDNVYEA